MLNKKLLTHNRKLNKIRFKIKNVNTKNNFRLVVYRTNKHIYAQIINLKNGYITVSASSIEFKIKKTKKELSSLVGITIAKRALIKQVKKIIFDRSGYIYHGRIKCLAEGARQTGLIF